MSFRGPSEARQSGTPEHRPLENGFRARRYAASRNDDITGYLVQSRLGALRAGARESITDQDQTIETPRFRDRKTGNYRTAQAVGQVFRHRLGSGTNGPATWVHGMFRSRSWPPLGHPSDRRAALEVAAMERFWKMLQKLVSIRLSMRTLPAGALHHEQDCSGHSGARGGHQWNGFLCFRRSAAGTGTRPTEWMLRHQAMVLRNDGARNDGGRSDAANALRDDVGGSGTLQFTEQPVREPARR